MLRVLSLVAFLSLCLVCALGVLLLLGVHARGGADGPNAAGAGGHGASCVSLCGCDRARGGGAARCSNAMLSFAAHALVVSLPYLYLVLFKFSRDLTEEAGQHALERIASTRSAGYRAAMGELELQSYEDKQHRHEMRRAAMDLV